MLLMSWWNCVQSPWKLQQHCIEGIIKHVCCYKRPQQRRSRVWADMYVWCDNIPAWIPSHPPNHHQPTSLVHVWTRPARLDPSLALAFHWKLSEFGRFSVCPKLFVHLGADSILLSLCCWVCPSRSRGYFGSYSCGTHRRQHWLVLSAHFFSLSLSGSEFQQHYRGFPPLRMTLFFLRAEECNR